MASGPARERLARHCRWRGRERACRSCGRATDVAQDSRRRLALAGLGLALLAPAAAPAQGEGTMPSILLSATGEAGARLHGRCVLRTATGETPLELDAAVPLERRLEGTGLACELEARGRVTVEIVKGGSRSRSTTRDGRMSLRVG